MKPGANVDHAQQEEKVLAVLGLPMQEALARVRENGPAAHLDWVAYLEAECFLSSGDLASAAVGARTAKQADPASPLAQAIQLFLADEPAKVELLQELVARWPDLERPRMYLAATLVSRGRDLQTAASQLRECVHQAPEDIQAWLYLGNALGRMGDRPGAREAYRGKLPRSLDRWPWARLASQRLFRVKERRGAFGVALGAARRFKTLKAFTFVFTIPATVYSSASALLAYALLGIFAVTAPNGEPSVPLLLVAGTWVAWWQLGVWAGDERKHRHAVRTLARWHRQNPQPAVR